MSAEKKLGDIEGIIKEFKGLIQVMERLRSSKGCPWDCQQTHQSLTPYLLAETYEVLEALDEEDSTKLCEELGDLLLQIVFHSQIACEEKTFDIGDVCNRIRTKLEKRHPHVFSDLEATTVADVSLNWENIKSKEKKERRSLLDGVNKMQPALLEAFDLQSRAAAVGFDWPDYKGALSKLNEEVKEVEEAIAEDKAKIKEELGDLLFAVVNVARFFEIDGETALRKANTKFRNRFTAVEKALKQKGKVLGQASLAEMDDIWEKNKKGSE